MNSTVRDDVHVCELCGAWYETRKGLSSHARAHLRQFGVNLESKGAPIEMLHKIIQSEEFQEKASAEQLEGSDFEAQTSPFSSPSTSSSISKNLVPLSFKGLTSVRLTPPPIKKPISPDVSGNLPLGNKAEFKSPPSAKKKISLDVSGNMPLSSQTELKSPPLKKKKKSSPNVSGILSLSGKGELKLSPPTKKQKNSTDVSEALPLTEKTEFISPPSAKKQKISTDVAEGLPLDRKAELKSPSRGKNLNYVLNYFLFTFE